jgi:hypothetical protein
MMVRRMLRMAEFDVAALAELADVDGADDLRRLGEARQHVFEVVLVGDAQGVLELEDEVGLGGAGRADQQQRLLGDGGDDHEVDQVLLLDEEAAQGGAEPVEASAQLLGLVLEVLQGPVFADVGGVRRGGLRYHACSFLGLKLRHCP